MPTHLAFDRTNWKISGGLLEEKVRFHRMLVSKGISRAIYPRCIAQGIQYEQYERKGTRSTDTNKYPLAGVRLFVGDQPPLDVSWEDQLEEEVSWMDIRGEVESTAATLFERVYGYQL